MMPKITGLFIALLIISFVALTITLNLSQTAKFYDVEYDNSSLASYQKLQEINKEVESIQSNISQIDVDSSTADILGGYFSRGYKTMKLTAKSADLFTSMADETVDDANLGITGTHLKTMAISITLIMIFVGIIVATIVKREM